MIHGIWKKQDIKGSKYTVTTIFKNVMCEYEKKTRRTPTLTGFHC